MFYPLIPYSSFKSTLYDICRGKIIYMIVLCKICLGVFSVLGWVFCLLGGLLLIKYTFKTEMF